MMTTIVHCKCFFLFFSPPFSLSFSFQMFFFFHIYNYFILLILRLGAVFLLNGGQLEDLADAPRHPLPQGEVDVLVPGEHADPRLHVVVHVQGHVVRVRHLSGRVGDLVFGALVLEG